MQWIFRTLILQFSLLKCSFICSRFNIRVIIIPLYDELFLFMLLSCYCFDSVDCVLCITVVYLVPCSVLVKFYVWAYSVFFSFVVCHTPIYIPWFIAPECCIFFLTLRDPDAVTTSTGHRRLLNIFIRTLLYLSLIHISEPTRP